MSSRSTYPCAAAPAAFPFLRAASLCWLATGLLVRGQTIEHLSNGSFEGPTNFSAPSSSGSSSILPDYHRSGEWGNEVINVPGWNMTALGTPDLVRASSHPDASTNHYLGTDGDHFISAVAYEEWQHEGFSTSFVAQAGTTYTLSFDYAQGGIWNDAIPGWSDYEWLSEWTASMTGAHTQNFYALNNPGTFSASSSGNPIIWESFSAEFTPTASGAVTLQFTTDNAEDWDSTYLFLDNASVSSPIPEPEWATLGLATLGILIRRCRR